MIGPGSDKNYTVGKKFTRPPDALVVTNFKSNNLSSYSIERAGWWAILCLVGGGGLHGDQMQRCNSLLDLVTAALQAFLNYHCHRYSRLAMANFQPSVSTVKLSSSFAFIFLPSIPNFYRQSVVCLTPADGHWTERFDCPKKILHS